MATSVQTSSAAQIRTRLRGARVGTFSRKLSRIAHLPALLGAASIRWLMPWLPHSAESIEVVIGWGCKRNTRAGRSFARRHGLPYFGIEDGFFRSVGLGVDGDPPLSVVIDDLGIYYDARHPSRLEHILNDDSPTSPLAAHLLLERADRLIETIVTEQISKYNNSAPREAQSVLGPQTRTRILIVDQTAGDLSIEYGLAQAETFTEMLAAARRDHPNAEIIIKTHPDVVSGKKRGHFSEADLRPTHERLLASSENPIALLGEVDCVYVVSSQLGFEALVCGIPVVCFGVPFYAGWGLTDDRGPRCLRRDKERTIRELFAAAILVYPSYLNPDSLDHGCAEDVIDHLVLQRRMFSQNRGSIYCIGFRSWKHNFVRSYLRCPGNQIQFVRDTIDAINHGFDTNAKLITWGQRGADCAHELMSQFGVPQWRMEDAFLRSVGLGSDLTAPASLVLDPEGIYYDPRTPSKLERIIETGDWSVADVQKAAELRKRLVKSRVSKYNVGHDKHIEVPSGKRMILVVGQVEDDASIEYGCVDIRTNRDLLEAVRRSHPSAFILWKPHPDVVSGNRQGAVPLKLAHQFADRIEDNISLADCLAVADEIHTMTSLVGFEGLLRDIDVVVYGRPFYAGWGLTQDRHKIRRRSRQVSIDELTCAALIRYPRYLHPVTSRFTTAETIANVLALARSTQRNELKISWSRRQLRKLGHLVKEFRRVP